MLGKRPDLEDERQWLIQTAKNTKGLWGRITTGQMWSLIECSENKAGYATSMKNEILSGLFTEPKAHLLRCFESRREKDQDFCKLFEEVRNKLLQSADPIMKLAAENSPYDGK